MLVQIADLNNPNIIPQGQENVYVFSEDGFAQKIVYEVKDTTLVLLATAKGMSIPQLCTFATESVIESFDTVLRIFAISLYKLAMKNIPSEIIAVELDTDSTKIDEIIRRAKILELAEKIEDEEILADITERAKSYGSIEAMLNAPGISSEEFWSKLGVKDDLSGVEEYEIA